MNTNKYIDLSQWKERHPRMTAIAEVSPDDNNKGIIIAESNHPQMLRIQYEELEEKQNYKFIP